MFWRQLLRLFQAEVEGSAPVYGTRRHKNLPASSCFPLYFSLSFFLKKKDSMQIVISNKVAVRGGTRCGAADPTGRRLIESAELLLAARHQSDPPPGSDLSQVRQVEERQGSGPCVCVCVSPRWEFLPRCPQPDDGWWCTDVLVYTRFIKPITGGRAALHCKSISGLRSRWRWRRQRRRNLTDLRGQRCGNK